MVDNNIAEPRYDWTGATFIYYTRSIFYTTKNKQINNIIYTSAESLGFRPFNDALCPSSVDGLGLTSGW